MLEDEFNSGKQGLDGGMERQAFCRKYRTYIHGNPTSRTRGEKWGTRILFGAPQMWLSKRSTGAEILDLALYSVAPAIGLHRVNGVVVLCLRCQPIHSHAKNRVRMVLVQADGRFCCLAKILRVRAVMHDCEMLVRSARIVTLPPDDGRFFLGQFELWSLRDADARGSRCRRKQFGGVR